MLKNTEITGDNLSLADIKAVTKSLRKERRMDLSKFPGEINKPKLWSVFIKKASRWVDRKLVSLGFPETKIDLRRIHLLENDNLVNKQNNRVVHTIAKTVGETKSIFIANNRIKTDAVAFRVILHEMVHSISYECLYVKKEDIEKSWPIPTRSIKSGFYNENIISGLGQFRALNEAVTDFIAWEIWSDNKNEIETMLGKKIDDNDVFDGLILQFITHMINALATANHKKPVYIKKILEIDYIKNTGKLNKIIKQTFAKGKIMDLASLGSKDPDSINDLETEANRYISIIEYFDAIKFLSKKA